MHNIKYLFKIKPIAKDRNQTQLEVIIFIKMANRYLIIINSCSKHVH